MCDRYHAAYVTAIKRKAWHRYHRYHRGRYYTGIIAADITRVSPPKTLRDVKFCIQVSRLLLFDGARTLAYTTSHAAVLLHNL